MGVHPEVSEPTMVSSSVILEGIVGSTAYGLATADSDEDRLGVFVAPTRELLGLDWTTKKESVVERSPDRSLHELGKFCRLALKCNPTVSELLWLPEYTLMTETGRGLVALRESFLSTRYVRAAYNGYARQQVEKLVRRGDGSFSADTRKRTAKHARHCARLLCQGEELLRTGKLTVRLSPVDAKYCFLLGEQAVSDLGGFVKWFEEMGKRFERGESVLPDEPDAEKVNDFLVRTRLLGRA